MLNESEVKQLKQVNVSKDTAKAAERIKEAFSSASRQDKALIVQQTAQKRNSLYRAERTGSASARIILALAEVLNISPFYLDGSSDNVGVCTNETVKEYLLAHKYKKLVAALNDAPDAPKTKRRAAKAAKPAEANSAEAVIEEMPKAAELTNTKEDSAVIDDMQATMFRVTITESDKMREAAKTLDLQSATQLLEALYIRSKAGGNAERLCDVVKHCLLS